MLYSFSIPLTDKRSFLTCQTYNIPINTTHGENGFLRSFGQSKEKDIPISVVEDERRYAMANKGIRVQERQKYLVHDRVVIEPAVVFRRIFYNSCAARVDIGMRIKNIEQPCPDLQYLLDTVTALLTCTVYTKDKAKKAKNILRIGHDLAREYLFATTIKPQSNWKKIKKEWVVSNRPTIIIESNKEELSTFVLEQLFHVPYFERVQSFPDEWNIQLYYCSYFDNIPCWLIVKQNDIPKDKLRALKTYLLRLHQERETLRVVSDLLANCSDPKKQLDVKKVENYLDKFTRVYSRGSRDEIEQQKILSAICKDDKAGFSTEVRLLLSNLDNINLQYLENRLCAVLKKLFRTINFEQIKI